jgi:hypothetical protein
MPDIIQFLHPGGQYQINKKPSSRYCWNTKFVDGMYLWNNCRHCKKFLQSIGDYVDGNNLLIKSKKLLFWGEWEPCSYFQILSNCGYCLFFPLHIHSPKYCFSKPGTKNTDPLVFGSDFYYSNCNKKVQQLNLVPDSIILFGTNYLNPSNGEPCFVLDTIFLVGKRNPYSVKNWNVSGIKFKLGDVLYDVTLSKIKNGKFNLYTGINYSTNKNYFSFVPVKKYDQNSTKGFERVKFYHNAKTGKYSLKGIHRNNRGFAYFHKNASHKHCNIFWDSLVKKIRAQGFELGVRFDLPPAPQRNNCCCSMNDVRQIGNQNPKQIDDNPNIKSC